mmetsp:Transcript_20742/g.57941  ORF Transcript_20742/g.57941 Transcript_20742/m.57941 type:complete len:211 (+) Transcript_20742:98-730(+)
MSLDAWHDGRVVHGSLVLLRRSPALPRFSPNQPPAPPPPCRVFVALGSGRVPTPAKARQPLNDGGNSCGTPRATSAANASSATFGVTPTAANNTAAPAGTPPAQNRSGTMASWIWSCSPDATSTSSGMLKRRALWPPATFTKMPDSSGASNSSKVTVPPSQNETKQRPSMALQATASLMGISCLQPGPASLWRSCSVHQPPFRHWENEDS